MKMLFNSCILFGHLFHTYRYLEQRPNWVDPMHTIIVRYWSTAIEN